MKILDKYVVRNFLFTAVICFFVLMSLRVIVDMFFNMDEFAEKTQRLVVTEVDGKSVESIEEYEPAFGEILENIGTYYSYQSLIYLSELGGVIIVAAAAFSLARMNHTNELTAMLASGISMHRVVLPIIICAMLLGGAVIADQELFIPHVAHKLVRRPDEIGSTENFPVSLRTDGTGAAWYSPRFRSVTGTMEQPWIIIRDKDSFAVACIIGTLARQYTLRPLRVRGRNQHGWLVTGGHLNRVSRGDDIWRKIPDVERIWTAAGPEQLISTARKQWSEQHDGAPAPTKVTRISFPTDIDSTIGMTLSAEGFQHDPNTDGEDTSAVLTNPRFSFAVGNSQPIGTFLADSARWIPDQDGRGHWKLTNGRLFYASDLTKEDLLLRESSKWVQYMSSAQLTGLLKLNRVPDRKRAQMIQHLRVAEPMNNLIMLLLGLPFILSRERNVKASAGLCLLIVGSFYLFIYTSRFIGLPPAWAAWLPILIFGPISVVMFDTVKT